MSYETIQIELRLDILPNNKVPVPGCEPISNITSRTLQQRQHCQCVYVDLVDVLAAIPQARVEFGTNWGNGGYRKKWLILPPHSQICCIPYTDWYALLRTLCSDDVPVVERYAACDVIGQGFCPSPGFDDPLPAPNDPYMSEGHTPYSVSATLGNWVPPWQQLDATVPVRDATETPTSGDWAPNGNPYDPNYGGVT